MVERGLAAEGGPNETGLPTFPSRRFVHAGGLTVLHEGLLEYELVDIDDDAPTAGAAGAHAAAQPPACCRNAPMRRDRCPPARSCAPTGRRSSGRTRSATRWSPRRARTTAYAAVDEAFLPIAVTRAPGGGSRGARGTELEVEGAEVSAVLRDGGQLQVRVFNPTAGETTVTIAGHSGWLVDLRGRPVERFDESFTLAPWRIATAQLRG